MRAIVIDASVARSAGETTHPTSVACRKTLDAMLTAQHHLVMSRELLVEWKEHKSNYAHRWLYRMFARKRIRHLAEAKIDRSLYPLILRQVTLQTISEEAVEKDLHLIGTALATDQRVIALDKKIHRFMRIACEAVALLKHIIWLHPVEDNAPEWLARGAHDEQIYHLC